MLAFGSTIRNGSGKARGVVFRYSVARQIYALKEIYFEKLHMVPFRIGAGARGLTLIRLEIVGRGWACQC